MFLLQSLEGSIIHGGQCVVRAGQSNSSFEITLFKPCRHTCCQILERVIWREKASPGAGPQARRRVSFFPQLPVDCCSQGPTTSSPVRASEAACAEVQQAYPRGVVVLANYNVKNGGKLLPSLSSRGLGQSLEDHPE